MKRVLILSLLLFCGCYEYHQLPNSYYFDKYKGKSEHQILMEFGAPDRTVTDGANGKIIEYTKKSDRYIITAFTNGLSNTSCSISTAHKNKWYIQFYVNQHDSVYYYKSNIPGPIEKTKIKPKNSSESKP